MSQPARGSPLPSPWGGRLKKVPHPLPQKRNSHIEFGARSKGRGGTPRGSMRHDQGGLVCLCVFFYFFFFFKQSLMRFFLQPPVLASKQRAASPGVCSIRKNTQCGCGWVLGCLVFFPSFENFLL